MNQITVSTATLRNVLAENRSQHQEDYQAALAGWKQEVAKAIQAAQDCLDRGEEPNLYELFSENRKPEDHTDEYTLAINMLAMHEERTITLTAQEYENLVADNWRWKKEWVGSNSKYWER